MIRNSAPLLILVIVGMILWLMAAGRFDNMIQALTG